MKSLSKETLLSGDSINDKNDLPPQYTPSSSNHVESSIYTPIYTQMAAMCLDLNTLLPSNAKDFASHFEQEFAKLTPRDPPIAQQLGLRNLNATIQICALTMKLIDKNGERLDPFDPAHKNHLERRSEYRYAYPMRQNIMHNLATLCDNLDTLLALLHELSTANILEPDQKERILILVEMASLPISERVLVLHKQCIRLLQLAGLHVEGTVESINVDVLAREHWKRLSTLMKMISPEEFKNLPTTSKAALVVIKAGRFEVGLANLVDPTSFAQHAGRTFTNLVDGLFGRPIRPCKSELCKLDPVLQQAVGFKCTCEKTNKELEAQNPMKERR